MMINSTLRTVATVLILVGCAVAGPGLRSASAAPVLCPGLSCDVTITVTGNPESPTIAVSANELKMDKGKKNVMITWKLENSPEFELRADSIRPYLGADTPAKKSTPQATWNSQIKPQSNNDKQVKVKNANNPSQPLYYNVKVYRKSNGVAKTFDPVIYNDP